MHNKYVCLSVVHETMCMCFHLLDHCVSFCPFSYICMYCSPEIESSKELKYEEVPPSKWERDQTVRFCIHLYVCAVSVLFQPDTYIRVCVCRGLYGINYLGGGGITIMQNVLNFISASSYCFCTSECVCSQDSVLARCICMYTDVYVFVCREFCTG